MSKMRTTFGKGRKGGVTLLAVTLAVLMVALGLGVTANATLWGSKYAFSPIVGGTSSSYTYRNVKYTPVDGKMSFPLKAEISLAESGVFQAQSRSCSGVTGIKVESNVDNSTNPINVTLKAGSSKNFATPLYGSSGSTFTYSANRMTYSDINNALDSVLVTFDDSTGETSGKVTLTLTAYGGNAIDSDHLIETANYYTYGWETTYTCTITFFEYAKGEVVTTAETLNADAGADTFANPKMEYKNSYLSDYGEDYETAVPQGTVTAVDVEPDDSGQGKATFQLRITSGGDPDAEEEDIPEVGTYVWAGYQIARGTAEPSNSATVYWLKESGDYYSTIYSNGTNKKIQLYEAERDDPIPVAITGLDADVTYTVRGVFATDAMTGACTYTDPVRIVYSPPKVSNFKIGSTDQIYKSAAAGQTDENGDPIVADTMNLTMLSTLSDGASAGRLVAKMYFTPNLDQVTDASGTLQDQSKWYLIDNSSRPSGDTGTFQTSWAVTTPRSLKDLQADYAGSDADDAIDSVNCAYKLVLTDTQTGYNVVEYSDPFKVDSEPPSQADVKIVISGDEEEDVAILNFDDADETTDPTTTGGAGATVKLHIGPATDISGIRSYERQTYFISSENAQNNNWGATPRAVAEKLSQEYLTSSLVEKNSTWTATPIVSVDRGGESSVEVGELTVAKGGYYMINTRAVDNAGRTSAVETVFFVVDLSQPSTPRIELVKEVNDSDGNIVLTADGYNTYTAYDSSTYTDSKVWLFAYSEPLTGKTLKTFSYSLDSGLTWVDMLATDASGNLVYEQYLDPKFLAQARAEATARGDGEIRPLETAIEGIYDGDTTKYQIGIALSRQDISDYKSIIVKATDTLPNESLTSEAKVMRTIAKQVTTSATLTHTNLEVALAMGNTSMVTSQITPDLKNAAAKKINLAYYGETGSTDITASDFNPYLYTKDHACTWADAACTGSCKDGTSCPYYIAQQAGYSVYLPELVNVQGMSNADAASLNWTRFDHSHFNTIDNGYGTTVNIATVAYTSSAHPSTTTLGGHPDYTSNAHTLANGDVIQVAAHDRVVYAGQTSVVDLSDATTYNSYTASNGATYYVPKETATAANANTTIITTVGQNSNIYNWSSAYVETYKTSGKWNAKSDGVNGYVTKRIYHLSDISAATNLNAGADLNLDSDMSRIAAYNGYYSGTARDWMILYNDQPTKKTINFSMNDSNVIPHSSDGAGFFFNTTIRQSKYTDSTTGKHRWLMSGYLLYDGNSVQQDSLAGFKTWIVRLTDVDVETWADGYGTTGYELGLKLASANTLSAPYGGGLFQTIAFSNHDTTSVSTRNYRLECEGNWSRFFLYNSQSSNPSYGTPDDNGDYPSGTLGYIFANSSDSSGNYDKVTLTGSAAVTGKYKIITWKNGYNSSTTYTPLNYYVNASGSTVSESVTEFTPDGNNSYDGTWLYTPRPIVNAERIGVKDDSHNPATVHTDSNCYGFGPMAHARQSGHTCDRDSRVVFSNVNMTMVMAKKLSEVVTEPSWGNGKAKFITNISDDAVEDFQDPVLTAQIQWRMNNDDTRYIGWGKESNRSETINFLERMMGTEENAGTLTDAERETAVRPMGMYQNGTLAADNSQETQIDNVATYITEQYYAEFGYDVSEGPIQDQVAPEGGLTKGTVYDLSDVDNIEFNVEPAEYKDSSANPDFPAGRWYMVHDTLGYSTSLDPRSGQYSDALDTNISLPGRYTFYFAPDAAKVKAGTLDPDDSTCVFDFIVNQRPVAAFSASMKMYDSLGHELQRDGSTYYVLVDGEKSVQYNSVFYPATEDLFAVTTQTDGNGDTLYLDAEGRFVNADRYVVDSNGDLLDEDGATISTSDPDYEDQRVKGTAFSDYETGTEARNEMVIVDNAYDPDVGTGSSDPYKVAWDSNTSSFVRVSKGSPDYDTATAITGITETQWRWELLLPGTDSNGDAQLKTVVSTNWSSTSPNGMTLKQMVNNSSDVDATYSTLNKEAVFTIYQRVRDVTVRRTWDSTAGHYVYESTPVKSTSLIKQVNVGSSDTQSVNAPAAGLSLSKPFVYNTAKGNDALITITRNSSQSQGEPFAITWQYGMPGEKKKDYKDLVSGATLYPSDATKKYDYYMTDSPYSTSNPLLVLEYIGDEAGYTDYAIQEGVQIGNASKGYMTSSTGGIWRVPFDTITALISDYIDDSSSGLILQATESVFGLSAEDVNINNLTSEEDKHYVTDQTSRTILYKTDKKAPSAPVITSKTTMVDTSGNTQVIDYQASSYLDVSGNYEIGADDGNGNIYKTASDQFITIRIGGSKDMEGVLGGYAFYFYDRNEGVATSSGSYETAYYAYDPLTHTLTAAPTTADSSVTTAAAAAAATQATAEFDEKYGEGGYSTTSTAYTSRVAALTKVEQFKALHGIVTVDPDTLVTKLTEAADAAGITVAQLLEANADETAKLVNAYDIGMTSSDAGYMSIIIDGNSVRWEGTSQKSIDSLNLAIFAFDNQTYDPDSWYATDATSWKAAANDKDRKYSEANETAKTRIEDIKLTKSQPMPAAISVKNNTNGNVASISNDKGYRLSIANGETDVMTTDSELNYYSNTSVTVTFSPRKARFVKNANGTYTKDESGTEYYEDWTEAPDLTAAANIAYYVKYAERKGASVWTEAQISGASDMSENLYRLEDKALNGDYDVLAPSTSLTFSKNGYYELTAWVVNGSQTPSNTRTVSFTVDQEAPTGMNVNFLNQNGDPYVFGSWASQVTINVSGVTDNIEADIYQYSLDNGATWTDLGSCANNWSLTIPDGSVGGGEYQVVVRARDKAKNYLTSATRTVKVDRTPPTVSTPTLEADSTTTELFEEYVVSLSYDTLPDSDGNRNYIHSRHTEYVYDEDGAIVLDSDGEPETQEIYTDEDTEIAVPAEGDLRLEFYPATGKSLSLITTGASWNDKDHTVYWSSSTTYDSEDDNPVKTATDDNGVTYQYLDLTNLQADVMVKVEFVSNEVSASTLSTRNNKVTGVLAAKAAASLFLDASASGGESEEETGAVTTTVTPVALTRTLSTSALSLSNSAQALLSCEFTGSAYLADGMFSWTFGGNTYSKQSPEVYVDTDVALDVTVTIPQTVALSAITWADGTQTIEVPTPTVSSEGRSYAFTFTPTSADGQVKLSFALKRVESRAVTVSSGDSSAGSAELVISGGVATTTTGYSVPSGSQVTLKMIPVSEEYAPKKITMKVGDTETVLSDGEGTDLAKNTPEGSSDTSNYYYTLSIDEWDSANGTDPGVELLVDFGVASSYETSANSSYVTYAITGNGSVYPAADTNGGAWVPPGGRQFTFTPDTGYRVSSAKITGYMMDSDGVNLVEVERGLSLTVDADTRVATATVSTGDWVIVSGLEVTFARQTYSVTRSSNLGGSVDVDFSEVTESATMNAVPEGVALTFNIKPDRSSGYRVESVVIKHGDQTIRPGAVSSYRIASVKGDITVRATFKGREATRTVTLHTITVRADKVKDSGADLDQDGKPYRFCIRKGTLEENDITENDYTQWSWTAYSSSYVHTFSQVTLDDGTVENLDPNEAYCVFVRAVDRVGNESEPVGNQIYTLANVPSVVSVENYSDANNTTSKSVRIHVSGNGNPSDTEYLVQVANDSLMSDMSPATVTVDGEEVEAWSTLDEEGKLLVTGLTPGKQYYFQVQARNKDGVITSLNKNGTLDIMLSPAAPSANTFYYKEQASPVAGVELGWDSLPSDVQSIEIYRDGNYIATVGSNQSSYTDDSVLPKDGFADSIVQYSYAFVNVGGTGSSQDAISYEYYTALKDADTTKATKMNDLIEGNAGNSTLYTQDLTYPRFPLARDKDSNIQAYIDSNAGIIDVELINDKTDEDAGNMGHQQYYLILKAYEMYDENGDKTTEESEAATFVEVPVTQWDKTYASNPGTATDNITADGKQIAHKSYFTSDRTSTSARARWTGLNNAYVYQIYMVEVRSTGYEARPTQFGQKKGVGVEGLLGKTYFVNSSGYGFYYDPTEGVDVSFLEVPTGTATATETYTVYDTAQSKLTGETVPTLSNVSGTWAAGDAEAFAGADTGFETPLHNGYIYFNQSPAIDLPQKATTALTVTAALENNDSGRIATGSDGIPYLVVDRSLMTNGVVDRTFKITVDVSDPDGPGGKKDISVGGEISYTDSASQKGLPGTPSPALASDYVMPTTSGQETLDLLFNAGGVNTSNVYEYLTLTAYDGVTTTTTTTQDVKMVLNATTPMNDADLEQVIEVGTPVDIDDLVSYKSSITDSPSSDQSGLAKVAAYVLKDADGNSVYKTLFGKETYEELLTAIQTHNSAAETTAKALLEAHGFTTDKYEVYYNDLGSDEYSLTEKGAIVALLCAEPPVSVYVLLEDDVSTADDEVETYRQQLATAGKADEIMTTTASNGTVSYWVPVELAVEQGVCAWLTDSGSGKVTPAFVKDTDGEVSDSEALNTHELMLVTAFGGNTSLAPVELVVRNQPSVTILSQPKLGWVVSHEAEYTTYKEYTKANGETGVTIGEQIARYEDVIEARDDVEIEEVDGATPTTATTDPAYKEVTDDETGRTTYYVYKMSDAQGTVDRNKVSAKIQVEMGVYDQFQEVGMYIAAADTVVNGEIPDSALETPVFVVGNSNGTKPIQRESDKSEYIFTINKTGLSTDTVYYMWPFYKITSSDERVVSESFAALTTLGDYTTAYYGFGELSKRLYETDYQSYGSDGGTVNLDVQVMADSGSYGTVKMTMDYFMADEYGNYVAADGETIVTEANAVALTGQALEYAKQTVFFTSSGTSELSQTFAANISTGIVHVTVVDGDTQQGHMNVRITMERDVDAEEGEDGDQKHSGYTMITNGQGQMVLSVQDDESPVKSYKIGVVNKDDNDEEYLGTATTAYAGEIYTYEFDGLEEGYSTTGILSLRYENAGTGNLNNISAKVYTDIYCTTLSSDFIADAPNPRNLLADMNTVGTILISPNANLSSGVYTRYVRITANDMKTADYIIVRVRQVVGQTTLTGRITITPNREPLATEKIGSFADDETATKTILSLYAWDDRSTPIQTVEADAYGNYTFRNIVNGERYQIKVERDGFATYSTASSYGDAFLDLRKTSTTVSQTMYWNLCLRGGDINGDGTINRGTEKNPGDMMILGGYFNVVIPDEPNETWTEEDIAIMRRCDFNGDGVINALDRAYLLMNLNFKTSDYSSIVEEPTL